MLYVKFLLVLVKIHIYDNKIRKISCNVIGELLGVHSFPHMFKFFNHKLLQQCKLSHLLNFTSIILLTATHN